jgi:hypothetical protein
MSPSAPTKLYKDRAGSMLELAERLNRVLENLEEQIRGRVSPRDIKGFRAVMGTVEEITRVRLRAE